MLLNVLDYPTVGDALSAAVDGDRVYIPGTGVPYAAPTGGWSIKRGIEVFGDGPGGGASKGTVLVAPTTADNVFTLDASVQPGSVRSLPNVYIHDLQIIGTTGSGTGGKSAIGTNRQLNFKYDVLRLERLNVSRMGGIGLDLEGAAGLGDNAINLALIADCTVSGCLGAGAQFTNVYLLEIVSSTFSSNGLQGVFVTSEVPGGPVAVRGCVFEQNRGQMSSGAAAAADLAIQRSGGVRIDGCVFRNVLTLAGSSACLIDSTVGGAVISGCCFEQVTTNGGTGLRLARTVTGVNGGAIQVLPNRFSNCDVAIDAGTSSDISGCVVFPQYCEPSTGHSMAQQIVLPTTNNQGWFGAASVIGKVNNAPATALGGLLIPAYSNDPTAAGQPLASPNQLGLMVLINRGNSPQLRIFTSTGWQTATLI